MSSAPTALASALDYKRCDCMGKSPLRACRVCMSAGWLKLCPTCFGQGTLAKQARQSNAQGRTERCGFCMGVGWVPCPKSEIALAEELTGEGPSIPAPMAPLPEVKARRIQTRRKAVLNSKKTPVRKTPGGISIQAERLNPVETIELEQKGDTPQPEHSLAEYSPEQEVSPSSFAPEE